MSRNSICYSIRYEMININQLLKALPKTTTVLVEESFVSLDTHVDPARKARSSGISRTKLESLDQTADGHARTNWKVNSQHDSSTQYDVTVEVIVPTTGGLFAIAKEKWQPKTYKDVLTKSDVRVRCSCPDFYWSGMMHNNGPHGKYKGSLASGGTTVPNAQGDPIFPKIRNPSGDLSMCKHLHSVFKYFPANAFDIMSKARKYNNTTKTTSEKTEKVEEGKEPLEIIQEPPEREKGEPIQISAEEKAPILDSLYEAGEKMDQMVQNNASDVINDTNEKAETEKEPEKVNASDLIEDETDLEYVPREQPVSEIVAPKQETEKPKVDANDVLGNNKTTEIEDNIKKVSASDIINPVSK